MYRSGLVDEIDLIKVVEELAVDLAFEFGNPG
jgi:hypothetical protein